MKFIFALTLISILILPAFAEHSFKCQSPSIGEDGYSFKIKLTENELIIHQSSINARYRAIQHNVIETRFQDFPAEVLQFSCSNTYPELDGYSLTIDVFQTLVTVKQSSRSARYRVLAFEIK